MSYNRYVGRRCNFCGRRKGLRVDGTFLKHPISQGKTVCEGSYRSPSDKPPPDSSSNGAKGFNFGVNPFRILTKIRDF